MDATWASEWLDDYADAWRRGDDKVVAELFTDDAVYRSGPLRFASGGRCEELREYWHLEQGSHEPPEGWGT
jgi:hypothetical protein